MPRKLQEGRALTGAQRQARKREKDAQALVDLRAIVVAIREEASSRRLPGTTRDAVSCELVDKLVLTVGLPGITKARHGGDTR